MLLTIVDKVAFGEAKFSDDVPAYADLANSLVLYRCLRGERHMTAGLPPSAVESAVDVGKRTLDASKCLLVVHDWPEEWPPADVA